MTYLLTRNAAAELPWLVYAYYAEACDARLVCAFTREFDALVYIAQNRDLAPASAQS